MVLFSEKLSKLKSVSLCLALMGVILFSVGRMGDIWISLTLAFSFAFYGAAHKKSTLKGVEGLFCEVTILCCTLIPYLLFTKNFDPLEVFQTRGYNVFLAGAVTLFPLILFTRAVKRIPYTNVGLIQYLAPLGQFGLGVFFYNEPFNSTSLISFLFIWCALILFSFAELNKLK